MNRTIQTYRGRRGNRRGGAILEMALTLGLLLNLTFGMVEFGYFFYVKNSFANAAREGARAGIVPGAVTSDVTTAVTNALANCNFPANSYTTTITDTSNNTLSLASASSGTSVQVNVTATWGTIGAGFRPMKLMSTTKSVTGLCVMRKE